MHFACLVCGFGRERSAAALMDRRERAADDEGESRGNEELCCSRGQDKYECTL
jgi:hypothetical protein